MVETQNTTMPLKLAKSFASFSPEDLQALKNTFGDLDHSAHEKAKFFLPAPAAFGAAWDELLPVLCKMQSFLSQRGADRTLFRAAALPTWTEWFESFKRKSGLRDTLRTVQMKLKNLRSMDKPAKDGLPNRSSRPPQQSPKNQRRLIRAAACLMDVLAAFENGGDPSEPLAGAERIALNAGEIERWLDSSLDETELLAVSNIVAVPPPATSNPVVTSPVIPQQLAPALTPLPMPMPGDASCLSRMVNDACGKQIRAAIEGLEPREMAKALDMFLKKLVQMTCLYDGDAGEITVRVEYKSFKTEGCMTGAAIKGKGFAVEEPMKKPGGRAGMLRACIGASEYTFIAARDQ